MREAFQEELNNFLDKLILLGNAANESIYKAMKAFNDRDQELAHQVVSEDLKINGLNIDIEQDAYRLIALQQPVATDLRQIFAILLTSSDIERLADHAANMCRTVIRNKNQVQRIETIEELINDMAEIVQQMVADSIQAFIQKDVQGAKEIAGRDDSVDGHLSRLYTEISSRLTSLDDQELVNLGLAYVSVGNSLERIGDYVTNICERVIYLDSGDIVELD